MVRNKLHIMPKAKQFLYHGWQNLSKSLPDSSKFTVVRVALLVRTEYKERKKFFS